MKNEKIMNNNVMKIMKEIIIIIILIMK